MIENSERQVVVVGAGIIGAMIAWNLVRAGMKVTIIEANEPGGVATPCSFGWVNATHGNPKPYFDLRVASMALWQDMVVDDPSLECRACGTVYLYLDKDGGSPVDLPAFAASHRAWGYDIEQIGGNALRQRAPHVTSLPESGLWAPGEGAAEGTEIALRLLKACVSDGATALSGTPVERLIVEDGRVVGLETKLGRTETDEIVVAAGASTSDVISDVAPSIPLETPQGILIHTKPVAPLIPHITLTRDLHIRQRDDGSLIAGWDFGGAAGPDDPQVAAEALMQKIRDTFHGTDDIELANVTVGLRPTPRDGFPVVGRPGGTPGLTVAVLHSGVTLAPIVGQAVATLIETGEMHPLLEPFGPDRF